MPNSKISALTSATTPLAGTEVLPVVQGGATKQVSVANLTTGRSVSTGQLDVISGTLNFGLGGAGTNNAVYTINGSSASSYGPYIILQRNSVAQWYIGCDSGINGGTSSDLTVYSGSNNMRLYNDVKAMNGNFVQGTAAKGINFTANTPAAGMTSQLLNWYEEGTFTPAVRFGGGTTGITYSRQNGRYTRVGKLVTVTWDVRLSNKGSSTGAFTLAGLPFSAEGAGGGYSTSQFYFYSGFTTIKKMGTSYTNNGTTLNEVVDSADVAVSDTHFTNTSIFFGSLTYLAA